MEITEARVFLKDSPDKKLKEALSLSRQLKTNSSFGEVYITRTI